MAQKSASKSKQPAQGGGRTANTEPRFQVFRDFSGCNFQESPHEFTLGIDPDKIEQSDLQMNYVIIQNNASIEDNKTIATRAPLQKLFDAPKGTSFTDASILIGSELYIATDDGELHYANLGDASIDSTVNLVNQNDKGHTWESFCYVDDKIIGATAENQLWTGYVGEHMLANAKRVPDPDVPSMSNLTPRGDLKLSTTITDECCFRIAVAYSYINKFGPTQCSDQFAFYANYPVSEWHGGCFLTVHGNAPVGYDIQAVEVYYTVDNSSQLVFAGRTDFPNQNGGEWSFAWIGYLDVTSMWPMANLLSPTDNYTEGVPVSRMTCIDSRMYFWGSDEDPYRLYIGGNPGNLFSVSPGTGGGFVDVEPGTGQEIRVVDKYKTQSGNSIVTMLCDSENSTHEQRFNLVENTVTISNEQNMKSWQAEQVSGAVGCKSYHGAKVCEDGLYSVSRYGVALTTMTMEYNSQIRTNYVSSPIKPVFTDKLGQLLSNSQLLELDGVLYFAFGTESGDLDNLIFCYDIDLKAWWTYTLDIDESIIDLIHIDYEAYTEGIGIVTPNSIYLLPTIGENIDGPVEVLIETGELANTQPQQGWQHLTQLEFRFDRFIGDLTVELIGIDQFGRKVNTVKHIHHDEVQYDLAEYMRVDLKLQSYKLILHGKADFRLTHFIAKCYVLSNRVGIVWGFNDSQSYRTFGDIHPTFKDYNDIRKAIIP